MSAFMGVRPFGLKCNTPPFVSGGANEGPMLFGAQNVKQSAALLTGIMIP
ncbi:hypothetical protein [Sphingomonas sp. SORGH_AS_0879]|nr:hypothetical protein [Sphingomonas sp. SORGH_AS_0879]MDQ1231040.1 hypothetical protein [Sphingomonas sp. SORGH_AS_0879]